MDQIYEKTKNKRKIEHIVHLKVKLYQLALVQDVEHESSTCVVHFGDDCGRRVNNLKLMMVVT